jgi:ribosomal protein S18 acetylase RimI-like enzyme
MSRAGPSCDWQTNTATVRAACGLCPAGPARSAPLAGRRVDYRWRLAAEDLIVRACRPRDVSAVLELWLQGRSEHATSDDRMEDVQRLIAERPGSLLVADRGGELLGALIAAWDGWRGSMYRLVVRLGHRRHGVGLALVRAGEEHLRRQGARRVTALVAYEDDVAAAFWESAGYPRDRVIGRRVRNL